MALAALYESAGLVLVAAQVLAAMAVDCKALVLIGNNGKVPHSQRYSLHVVNPF
jgi:hypothetical protein